MMQQLTESCGVARGRRSDFGGEVTRASGTRCDTKTGNRLAHKQSTTLGVQQRPDTASVLSMYSIRCSSSTDALASMSSFDVACSLHDLPRLLPRPLARVSRHGMTPRAAHTESRNRRFLYLWVYFPVLVTSSKHTHAFTNSIHNRLHGARWSLVSRVHRSDAHASPLNLAALAANGPA